MSVDGFDVRSFLLTSPKTKVTVDSQTPIENNSKSRLPTFEEPYLKSYGSCGYFVLFLFPNCVIFPIGAVLYYLAFLKGIILTFVSRILR